MIEKPTLKWRDAFHFFPFLIALGLSLVTDYPYHLAAIDGTMPQPSFPFLIQVILGALSLFAYNLRTLLLLRHHKGRVRQFFANVSEANSLAWVNGICWLFLVGFCVQITSNTFPRTDFAGLVLREALTLNFIGYFLMLSFFIVRQPIIFSSAGPSEEEIENTPESKYAKSKLDDEKTEQILTSLLRYMDERKPYLSEDLGINEIANAIATSTNNVSQVLNVKLQKNFYSFVNEYRVQEVKERLGKDEFKNYPIFRVALECGFNSKSSFNAIFRKSTGLTPSEYKAKFFND